MFTKLRNSTHGWLQKPPKSQLSNEGFTTIEVLVVVVILGILTAIAAPGWLNFVNQQRVKNTSDAALQTLRRAQSKARTENRTWQASFRVNNDVLESSTHRRGRSPSWQVLSPETSGLVSLSENSNLTADCEPNTYCVRFQQQGRIEQEWLDAQDSDSDTDEEIGRIAFVAVDSGNAPPKRCIIIGTILGSIRLENCE